MIKKTVLGSGTASWVLDGITPAVVSGYATDTVLGTAAADIVTVSGMVRGSISLGAGNDVLTMTTGTTVSTDAIGFTDGSGNDTVTWRGSGLGSAVLSLGSGNDTLTISGEHSAVIDAGAGDDRVAVTLDGSYLVHGGLGYDTLVIASLFSAVTFDRAFDNSTIIRLAKTPADVVQFDGFELVRFSDGTTYSMDQLAAYLPPPTAQASGAASHPVIGTAASESLVGTAANDVFYGGGGYDTLAGGLGDDWYQVNGTETVVEQPNQGIDTVMYSQADTYTLPANVENLILQNDKNNTPSGAHEIFLGYMGGVDGIGNNLGNVIIGSAADNTIDGKGGNDSLTGGGGRDTFVFGATYDHDVITDFTPGTDKIRLISGIDTWAATQAAMTDTPGGVLLTLSYSATLLLQGVTVAQLKASDFQYQIDLTQYHMTFDDEFTSFLPQDGHTTGGTWMTRSENGDGTYAGITDAQAFVDQRYYGVNPFSDTAGVLSINATYRPDLTGELGGKTIVSGAITTDGSFAQEYGYFEARLKLPSVAGGAPAFWLLPEDGTWPPEIDIMEQLGRLPGQIYEMGNWVTLDTTQWHTYGLQWTSTFLAWYVDGTMVYEVDTTAFTKPMYVLLTYALGNPWAGSIPSGTAAGASLGSMQIDWVHVYAANTGAAPAVTVTSGAPDVTFSTGTLAVGGTPASGVSYHYVADTSETQTLLPQDFAFAGGSPTIAVNTDRIGNTYSASVQNGALAVNVQVHDSVGGGYSFSNFADVELYLGGTGGAYASLSSVQSGLLQMGAGSNTVTLSNYVVWAPGRSTTMQVVTGAGNDSISGWTQASGSLVVHAGAGNDTIIGSGGSDLLDGGAGNDLIDLSHGGSDSVLIVKGQGTTGTGMDVIQGFGTHDLLVLQGFVKADLTVVDTSAGAKLTLPGETILLSGFKAALLGDWAYHFA